MIHILLGVLIAFMLEKITLNAAVHNRWRVQIHHWWHTKLCRILNIRFHKQGKLAEGSLLIVANHISWLDIPVLASQMESVFLCKDDVAAWPVIGYLCRQAGTVFIKRGDRRQGRKVVEVLTGRLATGARITVFPEGTTSCGRDVQKFHPAMFDAAVQSGCVVQPVVLGYFDQRGRPLTSIPYIADQSFVVNLIQVLCVPEIHLDLQLLPVLDCHQGDRKAIALLSREMISRAIRHRYQQHSTVIPEIQTSSQPEKQMALQE